MPSNSVLRFGELTLNPRPSELSLPMRSENASSDVYSDCGLAVSAWHNYIETFPHRDPGGCDPDNPCTIRWVEGLGFWTIPRMAAISFVLIIALLALDRPPTEEA